MVNFKQAWTIAFAAIAAASCTYDSDSSSASTTGNPGASTVLDIESIDVAGTQSSDVAATDSTTTAADSGTTTAPPEASLQTGTATLPDAPMAPRQGEEIGFGSIGPPIAVPQPWPMNTIYTDIEPQTLLVDFVPPNHECVAAQANATIGRAGAILVSLWVEGAPTDGHCPQSAERNEVRVPLAESIGGRRIYTSTVPETQGKSERAELVADSIIGLPVDDAVEIIGREGFEARDLTGDEAAESDFDTYRINIYTADGVIEFAWVG